MTGVREGRGEPLYFSVFRTLQSEITKGSFPIGTRLPSEAELVKRFGVSRQTVRQAVRSLRDSGLVRSHQGLGTIVEHRGHNRGYVHQVDTISDLFPVGLDVVYSLPEGLPQALPAWVDGFEDIPRDGEWLHVRALRARPGERPSNQMDAFLPIAFAGIGRVIEAHRDPIYGLIKALYGEAIHEVDQVIRSFVADQNRGAEIGMTEGETGFEIDRVYRVKSTESVAMLAANYYPATGFNFSMKLRRM